MHRLCTHHTKNVRVLEVKISFINNTSNIYDEMMYYNLTDAKRAKTGIQLTLHTHAKMYESKTRRVYAKDFAVFMSIY